MRPIIQTVTFDGGRIAGGELLGVGHGEGTGFVLSSLARVVWTTAVDVIGVFRVEGVLETLGLIQIELLCGLEGGKHTIGRYTKLRSGTNSYKRKVTHDVHRVPLLAENLADLAGAHHLVCGGDLWPALSCKDHEGVHGTLWGPVCVKRLGNQGISESGTVLVVWREEIELGCERMETLETDHWSEQT